MIGKSFVILAIVSYVHVLIWTIDGGPVDKKKLTSDLLKNDSQICPTGKKFFDSRNAKACEDARFPAGNETLSEKNEMNFLCLGLYDRAYRVCYLDSTKHLAGHALPESSAAFDAKVEANFPENATDVLTFCQNWKITHTPLAERVLPYVGQLNRVLKEAPTCIKMCAKFEGRLEPLCAILASVDAIFDSSDKPAVVVEKSEHDGKVVEVEVGTEKEAAHAEVPAVDADAGKKNEARNDQAEVQKPEERTPEGAKAAPKTDAKASAPEADSPPMTASSNAISQPKSAEPPTKTEAGDAVQGTAKVQNDVENEAGRTEKAGPEVPAKSPDAVDAKDEPPKKGRTDKPPADGEQAALGRENSDEDNRAAAPENEQVEDNADVISEHTQNDDQPTGGRPPSEDGEIEPPIISASDEDLNETPAQASVKHGYVPGMRGFRDDDDSHVFGYFTVIGVICIAGYVGYHNKQKILAMMLEGRRSRGGRGRRRPSTANYRKLDCTLEEAVTSQCTSNVTHVIY